MTKKHTRSLNYNRKVEVMLDCGHTEVYFTDPTGNPTDIARIQRERKMCGKCRRTENDLYR